jgi:hypothetical protein
VWPFRKKNPEESLRGAPEVRRLKTYSAESGYVYQYFYEGYRHILGGTTYVFSVSADRKTYAPVSVRILHRTYAPWEKENQRSLAPNEVYAIAKLALFGIFDANIPSAVLGLEFAATEDQAREILTSLDL